MHLADTQLLACHISFDLKFEMARDPKFGPEACEEKKTLGLPYCIKFEKAGFETFSLFSEKVDVLMRWKDEL